MISSTPEKDLTNPSKKRPRFEERYDGGLDTETISDLSNLSPIREDEDMYSDSNLDNDSYGYAVFPSFTEVDHHDSPKCSSNDSEASSEEAAFYPSHDDTLQSDQHAHPSHSGNLLNSFESEDSTQEQDTLTQITEITSTAARDRNLKLIAPVLITPCCSQQCLQNLTANEVLKHYVHFKSLNFVQQRQWLIDKLNENTSCSSFSCNMRTEASSATYYIVAGKPVCKTAWCQVLQISPKRVSKAMKVVKEGQISLLEHGMYVYL